MPESFSSLSSGALELSYWGILVIGFINIIIIRFISQKGHKAFHQRAIIEAVGDHLRSVFFGILPSELGPSGHCKGCLVTERYNLQSKKENKRNNTRSKHTTQHTITSYDTKYTQRTSRTRHGKIDHAINHKKLP